VKLLIYSALFLPKSGGVQSVVLELAEGLSARKPNVPAEDVIEVTVVTRTPRGSEQDGRFSFRLVREPRLSNLFRLVREADVVHVAGPAFLPMALALLTRKPLIVEHHGYQSTCPNGLLLYEPDHTVCPGYFMRKQYGMCVRCNAGRLGLGRSVRDLLLTFPRRWMCRMATRNIGVTNHVANRIQLPRSVVIYHGISDKSATAFSTSSGGDGEGLHIGYVGRMVSEKGVPILLKAAKRLEEEGARFQLTLVGDGPERVQIESLAHSLRFQNCVRFLGELRGDDLDKAVRLLQVVVMPSQWEETAGLAAIEQMMRGGVVVAADIGGLSEVVGESGLKFPAGDSESLYACLRKLIQQPALFDSLRVAARRRAIQAFCRNSMIEGHALAYREVLAAHMVAVKRQNTQWTT